MRLRLRIERHRLPAVRAVWPVTNSKVTVAQLLQSLNAVFPLESDTWGLEDYAVSLKGFDLLHYHTLKSVCRDGDGLVVRPLQYQEVRERYATGRDQITAGGRHLIDGVAFGRPLLKGPRRPQLRIAPKSYPAGIPGGTDEVLMLTENGEESEDNDDGEFEAKDDGSDEELEEEPLTPDESSSSETSSDTSSESEGSSFLVSSDQQSTSSPASSGSESSWAGISHSPPSKAQTTSSSTEVGRLKINTLKRKRSSEPEEVETPANDLEKPPAHTRGIPFQGLSRTRARNARRRDTKRLKILVDSGDLMPGSGLEDLRRFDGKNQTFASDINTADGNVRNEQQSAQGNFGDTASDTVQAEASGMPTALDHDTLELEVQPDGRTSKKGKKQKYPRISAKDLETKRHELLKQIASGGIDVTAERLSSKDLGPVEEYTPADEQQTDDGEPPQELSSKAPQICLSPSGGLNGMSSINGSQDTDIIKTITPVDPTKMIPASVMRRAKLDLASSKRLVFGSLGVGVPKTQEQKEVLQKKLSEQNRIKSVQSQRLDRHVPTDITTTSTEGLGSFEGSENWQTKIRLRAVECCDPGVVLSTPLFPFEQRWDALYAKKKRKKSGGQQEVFMETYDKYNINGTGDALQYDDEDANDVDEWDDGIFLEDDANTSGGNEDLSMDEFPPLPVDLGELPRLEKHEVKVGDLVVFTELACDGATGWEPKMATRSAKIITLIDSNETHSDDGPWCTIQLASRDTAPVLLDEAGNRIYSKFEIPGDDSDKMPQPRLWEEFNDLRLLLRPQIV